MRAKAALEEAGGDLLDAMVILERMGKVSGPARSSYSTEYEEQKDYIRVRDKVEQQKKSAPSFKHTVGRLVKTFFSFIRHTVFIVTKEDSIIFTMPTWVLVLILFFFWEAVVPVMVIALFFKVNYSFDGAQNVKRANDILVKAGSGYLLRQISVGIKRTPASAGLRRNTKDTCCGRFPEE